MKRIQFAAPAFPAFATARRALCGVLCACCWGGALAQQVPDRLPSTVEPGRELRQPQTLQPVPNDASIAVPEASAAHPPPGAADISFQLSRVTVEGATRLSAQELERYYAALVGHTVSVADMFAVAAAIENDYRSKGYVTTRALLPEQQIEGGAVRIVVVEGFIADITFAQDIGAARAQIEALLAPLRGVKPIDIATIERRLLLANDLHGIQVRGTLQPSASERGASTLVVATERDPVDLSMLLDNRNSPYTGSNETLVRGSLNSFTRHAGTVALQAKTAFPYRREHLFQGSYEQSIGGNGLTAGVSALAAKSRPGRNLTPLDVDSTAKSASATAGYPLIRSRRMNLRIDGTFEYNDLDTDVLDRAYTRDRLRVLRIGMTFDRSDSWRGVNVGRVSVSQGFDIFGASQPKSETLSRYEGRSDFTKLGVQFARLQTLTDNVSVLASVIGQVTWDSLLASEQIALGGAEFGRAYDNSEISGDKGIDGVLELRYRPAAAHEFWNATQFYVYYDIGKIWNVATEYPQEESLASAGAGVRVQLPGNFYASLEVAQPLTHVVASEGDKPTRLFFSIATHL